MQLKVDHHGPRREKTVDDKLRLETQKLLDHSASLCSCLDAAAIARWGKLDEWQPFLEDVNSLMMSMDKLGNGKMAAAQRQRESSERKGPAREPTDPDRLNVRLVERGVAKFKPHRYAILEAQLEKAELYETIRVTDEHMGISLLTHNASVVRRSFYQDICFPSFNVKLYVYLQGGPYPSTAFIWRTPIQPDEAKEAAVISDIAKQAPITSSRAMVSDFYRRFTIAGMSKPALRAVHRHLCPTTTMSTNPEMQALDERYLKFVLERGDESPELFYDLRAMNGKDGQDNFEAFWDVMGAYLKLEVGESAEERRHSDNEVSYASKVISIPSLIREVTKILHAQEGHENDKIPCASLVRLQFNPTCPKKLTSAKFTRRFNVVRKVQSRSLRKQHEDAHWVAALHKYGKYRVINIRNLALNSGAQGAERCIVALGVDDKCKIPVGLPGLPINTGARPHGPVLTPVDEPLLAADHDTHKLGSIVPSVSLLKDIPEFVHDSWYSGVVDVVLHDAVFEGSEPFFHAANILTLLRSRRATPANVRDWFLTIQHDGGADHHNKNLKVRLSLLALKRCASLTRLDSERGCPNHSAALIHERCMSLLNLALQHTSLARPALEEDLEAMVTNMHSMAELRKAGGIVTKGAVKGARVQGALADARRRLREAVGAAEAEADGGAVGEGEGEQGEAEADDGEGERGAEQGEEEGEAEADGEGEAEAEDMVGTEQLEEQHVQRRLREGWAASMKDVMDVIADRFTRLELKGKPVQVSNVAEKAVIEELHQSLRDLDPSYNPKYRLNSDLSKMKVLEKYFSDPAHIFDSTYLLSMVDCTDPSCVACCGGWGDIPESVAAELKRAPVLPMLNPKDPGHFYAYDDVSTHSRMRMHPMFGSDHLALNMLRSLAGCQFEGDERKRSALAERQVPLPRGPGTRKQGQGEGAPPLKGARCCLMC